MADVLSDGDINELATAWLPDDSEEPHPLTHPRTAISVLVRSCRELARRLAEAEAAVERCRAVMDEEFRRPVGPDTLRVGLLQNMYDRMFPAARPKEPTT